MNEATRDSSVLELEEALEGSRPLHELETDSSLSAQDMLRSSVKRRAFLQRMGMAGLGMAAIGLLNGCNGDNDDNGGPIVNPTAGGTPNATAGGTPNATGTASGTPSATARPGVDQTNFPNIVGRNIDEVVLNYALALEIFEADIYRQSLNVASGLAVTTPFNASNNYALRVAPGALNANSGQVAQDAFTLLRNVTAVETAHRDFLRTVLRSLGAPIQQPNPGGYQFPGGALPGRDLRTILAQLRPIEEGGPRAYLGAAPFLTTLQLIQTAGTIYSVECRQAAAINDTLGLIPGPTRMAFDKPAAPVYPSEDTFEYFRSPSDVLRRIVPAFLRTDGSTNPSNGTNA